MPNWAGKDSTTKGPTFPTGQPTDFQYVQDLAGSLNDPMRFLPFLYDFRATDAKPIHVQSLTDTSGDVDLVWVRLAAGKSYDFDLKTPGFTTTTLAILDWDGTALPGGKTATGPSVHTDFIAGNTVDYFVKISGTFAAGQVDRAYKLDITPTTAMNRAWGG